ncbi:MAG: T9SS type A sorting domain-containing protein [Candidatus Eisenbacteria bacterium]|uniref:T9SS type A sorting domain-containing protein n=1 Tax=Eiseniibacteriota bacterium TaxID=2212470 RepID=A0A948RVD3_UNCEI|nr:T9SS type A sorting domain-containing protein [Candidatus Eisenbacteria bacterium]MBU2691713.1 T9SS type A sorting domain-containing protein [Candidatus Eisenbacteria bacterium]
MLIRLILFGLFLFLIPAICPATTWNVYEDSSGDAPTIQAAINAAEEYETILVSPGIYNESIDFHGKVLRILSTDGPSVTTITALGLNSRVVTMQESCGSFTELGGFTITQGNDRVGAGIRCDAPALIQGCIIEWNTATRDSGSIYPKGGGVFAGGGCRIIGNVIRHNRSLFWDPGPGPDPCDMPYGTGGGVDCRGCILERNEVTENISKMGGGVLALGASLRGNLFRGNVGVSGSIIDPRCLYAGRSGGVYAEDSELERNAFLGNTAYVASELVATTSCEIRKNIFHIESCSYRTFCPGVKIHGSNIVVERNTFVGPGAPVDFPIWGVNGEKSWVGNIFFRAHVGYEPPGGFLNANSEESEMMTPGHVLFSNAIPPQSMIPEDDFYLTSGQFDQGSFEGNIIHDSLVAENVNIYFPDWQTNNLIGDPLFCDQEESDFRLLPDSPALPGNNPFGWPDTIGAFGIGCDAVPVLLWGFTARWENNQAVLTWFLASDLGGGGLHIYRKAIPEGEFKRLTSRLLPVCSSCCFTDSDPPAESSIRYVVRFVGHSGSEMFLGETDLPPRKAEISLEEPFPNPATGLVAFKCRAPIGSWATITVYDAAGRLVRTLWDGPVAEYSKIVTWTGRTEEGIPVVSGMYFVRFQSGGQAFTQKVLMIQ